MMTDDIQIIVPYKSEDALSWALVAITEEIAKRDPDGIAHGFLGGEFGYGGHWDSDVFEMHPYYWGDCTCGYDDLEYQWCKTHKHGPECYQTELYQRLRAASLKPEDLSWDERRKIEDPILDELCKKHKKNRRFGCMVHCTCEYDKEWREWSKANTHTADCPIVRPNFLHKPSGFEVRWYKYIGRDNETVGSCDIQAMLNECVADIRKADMPSTLKRMAGG